MAMSGSTNMKKQCVLCNKSGGVFNCDGCQQSFCGKHAIEHRQQLGEQLDRITEEQDLLQQELQQPSLLQKSPMFENIDKWEQDSIAKIRVAAETARKTLQELLEQSKEQVSKQCHDIRKKLCSARQADDFTENDLTQWKKQLKEVESEITNPSSADLIPDKNSPIFLLKLETKHCSNNQSSNPTDPPRTTEFINPNEQEQFLQTSGPISIEENGYLARRNGSTLTPACIRGRLSYSTGCHMIRFKLEKFKQPYRIFIGCTSSQTLIQQVAVKSVKSVGWFGYNQVYEHRRCSSNSKKYGYSSTKLQAGDVLRLTIDCNMKQIKLLHERLNKTYKLSVKIELAPFPWQFPVVLSKHHDSVRILPNV